MADATFSTTKEEYEVISKIVRRAGNDGHLPNNDALSLSMDIEAVHCNGCPLDLQKLLNASDFDFVHDIYGMVGKIDRKTGKLTDCFLPRCAR